MAVNYAAEDGISLYVTEDGLSNYVVEGGITNFESWGSSWGASWGSSWGFIVPPPPPPPPPPTPSFPILPTDVTNYVFNFPSRTLAFIDPVVGPYLNSQPGAITELYTYDLRLGGVTTISGYWGIVTQTGDSPTLDASPELAFAIDQTQVQVTPAGLTGCFISNIDKGLLENIQVITPYGAYIPRGFLPPIGPPVTGTPTYLILGF